MSWFNRYKKEIIIATIFMLIVILVSPIIINFALLSWRTRFTFGDTSGWLNFFGTMISSVIGGIISGGLTFAGVLLTLKHQEKREFLKEYSEVRAKLDEILKEVITVKRYLATDESAKDNNVAELLEEIQKKLMNLPNVMSMATDINYHLYSEVKFKYAMQLELIHNHCYFHIRFGSKNLSDTIKSAEHELAELILEITTEQKRLSDEYKKYNRR